jgi:2,5-diketo-D-gluconate reductase A
VNIGTGTAAERLGRSPEAVPAPSITLNNGLPIPQLGFGVFQVPPAETQQVVELALEAGYRHIDTAAAYNNESGVGAALRATGIPREQVFITSKLRNGEHGYDSTLKAYADSCSRLGIDRLDLYLIHWPNPAAGLYVESWRAMERLYSEGGPRAVGVSNFLPEHLEALRQHSALTPAVNQIELHPSYQQQELAAATRVKGIAVEAYSPLGQGEDLDNPTVLHIAERHGVTASQVVLRWHLQQGNIVIPKTSRRERMDSNLDVLNFELSDDELAKVTSLEAGRRLGNDPATFSISQIR